MDKKEQVKKIILEVIHSPYLESDFNKVATEIDTLYQEQPPEMVVCPTGCEYLTHCQNNPNDPQRADYCPLNTRGKVSPPEPVKPEGLLLTDAEILSLKTRSINIRQLNETIEDVQEWNRKQIKDLFNQKLAKLQPELDRREARIKELQEACTYWEKIQPAITAQAKAEVYKEVADKVEGIENPYQEQGIESLNKCIGFGKCREAVKKILGKV
jgi:hypothetical protein